MSWWWRGVTRGDGRIWRLASEPVVSNIVVFSPFLYASSHLYKWVCPSVHPSFRLYVRREVHVMASIGSCSFDNCSCCFCELLRCCSDTFIKINGTNFFAFQTLITIAANSINPSRSKSGTQRALDPACHSDFQLLRLNFETMWHRHLI